MERAPPPKCVPRTPLAGWRGAIVAPHSKLTNGCPGALYSATIPGVACMKASFPRWNRSRALARRLSVVWCLKRASAIHCSPAWAGAPSSRRRFPSALNRSPPKVRSQWTPHSWMGTLGSQPQTSSSGRVSWRAQSVSWSVVQAASASGTCTPDRRARAWLT